MRQEHRDVFSKWIFVLLVISFLTIFALIQYSPQPTIKIDLTPRNIPVEHVAMRPEFQEDSLKFGFEVCGSPGEDAWQYIPFLKYLENETGFEFNLCFTPQNTTIGENLGTGKIQFAAIGASAYLQAKARFGVILIAQGLNSQRRPEQQSVFVVSPKSTIKNIEDLRGKLISFSSPSSTFGYLIPRIIMAEHGIFLDDLQGYEFSGSDLNILNDIARSQYDAGGLQEKLGRHFEAQGHVRIIYKSEFYPTGGIAANKDVPSEILDKVQQALLNFQPQGLHAQELYRWDQTDMASGFIEVNEEDYNDLRQWSIRFDLLDTLSRSATP